MADFVVDANDDRLFAGEIRAKHGFDPTSIPVSRTPRCFDQARDRNGEGTDPEAMRQALPRRVGRRGGNAQLRNLTVIRCTVTTW